MCLVLESNQRLLSRDMLDYSLSLRRHIPILPNQAHSLLTTRIDFRDQKVFELGGSNMSNYGFEPNGKRCL